MATINLYKKERHHTQQHHTQQRRETHTHTEWLCGVCVNSTTSTTSAITSSTTILLVLVRDIQSVIIISHPLLKSVMAH
jgi:hypothetical protein